METKHYQTLIKQCPEGGVVCVGENGEILAARSSFPEGAAYFLDQYAKAMGISPMDLMLQMIQQRQAAAPQGTPYAQPAPAYTPPPPPRPMEQAQPDNEPIPPGIIPDEARKLAERIEATRRGNGSMMSIAPLPLLACLALAHAWPFGV